MTQHSDPDSPAAQIERFVAAYQALGSEDAFVAEIEQIPPLADTRDWSEADGTNACRLVAAADVVGLQSWTSAIGPIYERAALGDGYEMMQSLRHGPERALIDRIDELASILEPLTAHARPGTRMWACEELGILRLARSRPFIATCLSDPVDDVRETAETVLAWDWD